MARPRSDIRRRIVRAARARFAVEGVDGASLRMIAKDARTSIGMISYYFRSKDELFLAAVEEIYAALLRDLAELLGKKANLAVRLRDISARLGKMSDDELAVVRLVAREALASSERFGRLLTRFRRGHVAMILRALGEGAARGEVDPSIPLPIVLACTFGIVGLPQIARRIAGDRPPFSALPEPDALAEAAASVLFGGVAPRTKRRPRRS
jgi:AcrR family transcriptional regulator